MAPTAVDLEIGRCQGKTVALEATPERLLASKNAPIPDLPERIHELTKENGQLRVEIKCLKEKLVALWDVKEDAEFAKQTLDRAIVVFREVEKEIEGDWYQAMEGVHGA
jgi:regulator of replication initiation timing